MILSFENVRSQPWVILENEQTVYGLISMCYQSDTNSLFSVDREFGSLIQWDLNTFSVVKVHDLEIKETNALRFSKNCRQIYGASEIETRKGRHGIEFNYFDNILVWDTKTGNVNDCFGDCEGKQKNPTQIGYIVNDKNNNYMNYYEPLIVCSKMRPGILTKSYLFVVEMKQNLRLDKLNFSRKVKDLLSRIGKGEYPLEIITFCYLFMGTKNMGSEKHVVSNRTVDSTGKRIARVWDDKLQVWEFGIFGKNEFLSTKVRKIHRLYLINPVYFWVFMVTRVAKYRI